MSSPSSSSSHSSRKRSRERSASPSSEASQNDEDVQFDLHSLTVPQLKQVCRENGLRVGGAKHQLISRLEDFRDEDNALAIPDAVKSSIGDRGSKRQKTSRRGTKSEKTVDKMLEALGMDMSEVESNCCKKAIARGFLSLEKTPGDDTNPLDKVVHEVNCTACSSVVECTIRDLLKQPDVPGLDYEDGGQMAGVRCPDEDCGAGVYLTRMCENDFEPDCGKFHQHCNECAGLGKCIGDYRMAHCENCGKHYFAGLSGFPCSNCYDEDGNPKMSFGFGGGRRRGGGFGGGGGGDLRALLMSMLSQMHE